MHRNKPNITYLLTYILPRCHLRKHIQKAQYASDTTLKTTTKYSLN